MDDLSSLANSDFSIYKPIPVTRDDINIKRTLYPRASFPFVTDVQRGKFAFSRTNFVLLVLILEWIDQLLSNLRAKT